MTQIIEPTDFYMLWTKTGHRPRHTHDTREDALTEAARLAAANPGKKFIVLHAVQKVYVQPRAELAE